MSDAGGDIKELLRRGFAALNAGRPSEAAQLCQRIISRDRRCVEAHFLVGLVATEMKDLRTAASAFGSVTKLAPAHAAAWAQLARVFLRLGQPGRAEKALEKATNIGTEDAVVEDLIGVVYSLLGDQKAAKGWYRRAVSHAADQPAYQVNLASALLFLGETDKAEAVLEALLSRHRNIAQADWLLSSLRQASDRSRADELMAKAEGAADAQSKAFYAYAAGKEYEDCKAWEAAFAAFDAGARAKRSTLNYDEGAEDRYFATLHEIFTPLWTTREAKGCDDPAPIFVVGQPRTGTTLIERIITSHSMVESAGELQQFNLSVRRLAGVVGEDRWSPEALRASAEIDMRALGEEYLRASAPMRGASPRFVDKLPANYLHIPLILSALPNARVVHLTRGAMDSCFASFKQLFAETYLHSYDQSEMARHFVRYARLMEHWRSLYPGRVLDVSYELTVSDLETSARRLIAFLGLDWEDACRRFHEQRAAVATASAVQVRKSVHTRSVGRWRRYGEALAPMRAELAAAGLAEDSLAQLT